VYPLLQTHGNGKFKLEELTSAHNSIVGIVGTTGVDDVAPPPPPPPPLQEERIIDNDKILINNVICFIYRYYELKTMICQKNYFLLKSVSN
jgi:hypothetical protein